jgi:Rrf2 family iron-sulfur cluster assembly transcriptional regulator
LEQLFRRLRKGNVVKSVRGPGGGYLLARSMDDIAVKDVLLSVGENINPARDIVGPIDMKDSTVEFVLTKSYFENLAVIMQEYLETTTLGDLIRRARGDSAINKAATAGAAKTDATLTNTNANRSIETDLS